MRKVIGAINMTVDGFCDHTAVNPDEEVHQYYADLLSRSDNVLYGRVTYQLMEFWRTLSAHPSGEKTLDDFARVMDKIPKIVFSHTLKHIDWETAKLANRSLEMEVLALKQETGNVILVGSRSLIIQLIKLNLIDELQIMVHPVIAGRGLPLFENIHDTTMLKLIKTKTFNAGAVTLYYQPTKE